MEYGPVSILFHNNNNNKMIIRIIKNNNYDSNTKCSNSNDVVDEQNIRNIQQLFTPYYAI